MRATSRHNRPSSPKRFFDEGGGMQLVIHAPFGGRINKAWGMALRKRFCRSFNFELQAAATDNGLNIALAEQHSFPLGDVFHYLQNETVTGNSGAGGAGVAHFRHALALGRQPLARRCCAFRVARKFRRRSSAFAATIFWRRCFPTWPLPGKHRRRHQDSRPPADSGGDEGCADRGHGYRRPAAG